MRGLAPLREDLLIVRGLTKVAEANRVHDHLHAMLSAHRDQLEKLASMNEVRQFNFYPGWEVCLARLRLLSCFQGSSQRLSRFWNQGSGG